MKRIFLFIILVAAATFISVRGAPSFTDLVKKTGNLKAVVATVKAENDANQMIQINAEEKTLQIATSIENLDVLSQTHIPCLGLNNSMLSYVDTKERSSMMMDFLSQRKFAGLIKMEFGGGVLAEETVIFSLYTMNITGETFGDITFLFQKSNFKTRIQGGVLPPGEIVAISSIFFPAAVSS